ncbi:MAG TPA: Spy/CpxP family protein refolding chaperone [Thermoanaerobaculia bacterium]|jgi:Spy/CpxP family protein refolding chaperone|nr:Spy/CpxP family protein refolding chaperone [Thermoanaerobaculia bacterium]
MKRILTYSLCAALVLMGAAFAVHAQGHGGLHGKMMGGHMAGGHVAGMEGHHEEMMAKALDLTADQTAAAKKLHAELLAKAQPLMTQHHQQMDEIKTLLDGASPDATEIGQKMITAHATGQQLKSLHEDFMTRFSTLLTADQKTKLEKMKQSHHDHAPFDGPPSEF